jgi:hypothetical protein
MMKSMIFAMLGLAAVLTLAAPPSAHAGVVVGLGVGPIFAGPAYGYVVGSARPYAYYSRPYAYAPGYVYPRYRYYRDYDRFDRDDRWNRYDGDRRWDRRDRDYDRREGREYDRHEYEERGYRR